MKVYALLNDNKVNFENFFFTINEVIEFIDNIYDTPKTSRKFSGYDWIIISETPLIDSRLETFDTNEYLYVG